MDPSQSLLVLGNKKKRALGPSFHPHTPLGERAAAPDAATESPPAGMTPTLSILFPIL